MASRRILHPLPMANSLGQVFRLSIEGIGGRVSVTTVSRGFQTSRGHQVASPQEDTASGIDPSKSSESQSEAPPTSKPSAPRQEAVATEDSKPSDRPTKQKYPLYPSVQHLLHEKGLSVSEADKIPASGPNGRLLKGDVLSYLGRIASSYSSDESRRISMLGHLDLSNIKIAKSTPKEDARPTKASAPAQASEPKRYVEIALPISFHAVTEVQKRIQDTLGVFLPISTFISRATDVANDDLPNSELSPPNADLLFNQVLGLDKVGSTSRGNIMPQITALPKTPLTSSRQRAPPSTDIIDILVGKVPSSVRSSSPAISSTAGISSATNLFSVSVSKGQEKRARIFLGRVKTMLEAEPGRLVL